MAQTLQYKTLKLLEEVGSTQDKGIGKVFLYEFNCSGKQASNCTALSSSKKFSPKQDVCRRR